MYYYIPNTATVCIWYELCEIRCKYDHDFNTAHVMIDQNWNDSLNYQMIQSVNVLKDMIDIRDCIKEWATFLT